jgi:integrase
MHLTDIVVKNLKSPGRFTDNQTKNLHLWVKENGRKYWIWRFTLNSKRYGMSLGAYPEVSLREARERAIDARSTLNKGMNPISERKAKKTTAQPQPSQLFGSFALNYIETMRPKWGNQKHASQWVSTVETYAIPIIGQLPLAEVDTHHILAVLEPIWLAKPETASRLRGRLERIFSAAITRRLRPPLNPALWKGHLETLMPPPPRRKSHHAAISYDELPEFISALQDLECVSALALEFTILNASRTSEVLLGRRAEVNGSVWTIPGERMKAKKQHQVPLCQRSLDILEIAQDLDPGSEFLFSRNCRHLSNMAMLSLMKRLSPGFTVHGFRSTFRDWVSEETDHSPEVAEMALAHTIGNKVEAAYRRGNLLERRRRLMRDWEDFCQSRTESKNTLISTKLMRLNDNEQQSVIHNRGA